MWKEVGWLGAPSRRGVGVSVREREGGNEIRSVGGRGVRGQGREVPSATK